MIDDPATMFVPTDDEPGLPSRLLASNFNAPRFSRSACLAETKPHRIATPRPTESDRRDGGRSRMPFSQTSATMRVVRDRNAGERLAIAALAHTG